MRVVITITDERPASDDTNEWPSELRLSGSVEVDPDDLLGASPAILFSVLMRTAREWIPE